MLKMNVQPDSVKAHLEQSRQIPNEKIEKIKLKLDNLDEELSTWKGNAANGHKEAFTTFRETLETSQLLMIEILNTIDFSMEQFSEIDHDVSAKFNKRMDFHNNK